MKCEASTRVDVDPLVFQSYKTFMVFATSWLLAAFGVIKPSFTPWGIVSAAFWVPAGTAGIYAVRRAGLAVSVGLWSSVIVIVSFIWGIVIFRERVRTVSGAAGAAILVCIGIWGVSFYSSPGHQRSHAAGPDSMGDSNGEREGISATRVRDSGEIVDDGGIGDIETALLDDIGGEGAGSDGYGSCEASQDPAESISDRSGGLGEDELSESEMDVDHLPHSSASSTSERVLTFLCFKATQYHLGLAMAMLNGLLAATIMVPLHWAGPNTRGLPYSISFGIGAVIITTLMWLLRFLHHAYHLRSWKDAFVALPSFHIKVMWRPGCLSGLLFSIGNISGIVSITTLGDFTGYSLGQASLLVSGLWGIFWYREVTAASDVAGWFAAAFFMLGGILLLSYEHLQ
eukprot:CAMPEP_0183326646 /NCGR_PEP_ID=MMETSP0160_2-20130417/82779_1 /TAXON_ID=2839 ORGANISM="Odontella Sinensis, Strain Grunow 1884" /NCGR_SAMPLE_ID=MMETSP0160_2 /ASSEMBLY_ACC=CAM_ASM_000250 /LENGTH=399 /DNA_ID=CAMNT_0025494679 /DNA_START=72 /DNA_END=1271 /DNA_ORIENTATION=-